MALSGKLKDGCDAAPVVREFDKPAGPPLAWQNEAQQWQLLVDLDMLDTEGQRTLPAPFNGVFVVHFSGATPSAGDSVMLENIKDGSSFVYGQEAPMITSNFDVFHVRVLRLSELMQQPPEMGVSPQSGSVDPDK